MVNTLLFDLDNTLLDFDQAEKRAISQTLEHFGVIADPAVLKRYSELNLAQWKLLELGKLTREQVKIRRFELLFKEKHLSLSAAEAAKTYETLLSQGHYFIDGAEELLEALSQTYRLYLVTNGTLVVQKGRLKSSGISRYFKNIFISEEIGYNKPSMEYFQHCFSQIPDFSKENTVIIGDSLTSDIQGGINAGIRTIWFNPKHKEAVEIHPDYESDSLRTLPDLLATL